MIFTAISKANLHINNSHKTRSAALGAETTSNSFSELKLVQENESDIPSSSSKNTVASSSVGPALRYYQQECIDKSLEAIEMGYRNIAVSLPVGNAELLLLVEDIEIKLWISNPD
ncbi:hypothetical protein AX774_g7572 [Zancudomyces culisetae]|uniref:Uncharacterized protein n=1 Tax=Zancudomyces culisetae TaxID=1213189 RepID=A0A1R1PDF0_ZANCU|nr:hypothetical protein AX774_g7572 [Zancudomyces culisetae]|eukprot:OMH79020.1 hypothetical protein AX774_g7572 [Zancudomyces culisetae]